MGLLSGGEDGVDGLMAEIDPAIEADEQGHPFGGGPLVASVQVKAEDDHRWLGTTVVLAPFTICASSVVVT